MDTIFCNQCGQTQPAGSKFCNRCGAPISAAAYSPEPDPRSAIDVQSRPRGIPIPIGNQRLSPMPDDDVDEHEMFTIRPTMVFVWAGYITAALVVIAVAALMGILKHNVPSLPDWLAFAVTAAVALVALAFPIYKHIQRRREVYTLTNHKLEMRYGILRITVRNIPLGKVQDVTVTASLMQRLMKLGNIEIDSAAVAGKIYLKEINHPQKYANIILAEMRGRN